MELPLVAVWLTTEQSGALVLGLFATWPSMHGGLSNTSIFWAMTSRAGANSASQIDSDRPLPPKCWTSSVTRTDGSA